MTNAHTQVENHVRMLVKVASSLVQTYAKLGIPLETEYKCTDYREGSRVRVYSEKITPSYLLQNYSYDGITTSKFGVSPHIYAYLNTEFIDGLRNEEVFRFRFKPEFVVKCREKGLTHNLHEDFKTIGYVTQLGNEIYHPIFEGYPRKPLLSQDLIYQTLVKVLKSYYVNKEPSIMLKNIQSGDTFNLSFETLDKLLEFLAEDGCETLITETGKVAIKCYVTIHGDSRVNYFSPTGKHLALEGFHVTNIRLFNSK